MCVSSRADVSKSQTPQQSTGHILHVASHIFCRHRGLGRVSTAFGGGQRELLADGMQSAGGLRPVGVVVPDEESLLSPGDDGVGDLHGARSDTTNLKQEEGLSVSSVSRPLACGGGSRVRRWSALGQTKARTAQPAGAPQDLLVPTSSKLGDPSARNKTCARSITLEQGQAEPRFAFSGSPKRAAWPLRLPSLLDCVLQVSGEEQDRCVLHLVRVP